jgi:hypothetical protein
MTGWQPIETAPKDGTRLLFWDGRLKMAISGCWHDEPTRDDPGGYDPGWAWWSADEDLIMWDSGPDDAPTHWMSLPAPPGGNP